MFKAPLVVIALLAAADPAYAGDAAAGKKLFQQNCQVCHSDKQDAAPGVGPSLFGVVGRKAGTLPGYTYSKAMVAYGAVWGQDNLARYLASPAALVRGNKMGFPGIMDPEKQGNIIAYLETLK